MPTPLREIPHRYRPRRDAFTPAVSLLCLMAVGLPASAVLLGPIREGEPELPRPSPWLDADEQPLDLGEEQILELLSSAPVVAWETIVTEGTTRPLKVLLERDGVRVHGIFRTVDDRRFDRQRRWGGFRDHYIYEVAAYELSRMLGLDNVPPTVPRNLDGQRGSVQLWIERSTSEGQRIRNNERLAWPARWSRQRHTMFVFDNLIYNFDRNHGNMLVDTTGKLWLVDHTRSFKKLPKLRAPEQIVVVDRRLWDRLRQLDPREVRRRSRPYLDSIEIQSLLRRHRLLVAHIEQLIAERGADAVLIGG